MTLPAITIRQPWADLIVRGTKTIENRSRRLRYRGLLLIHASASLHRNELAAARHHIQNFITDPLEQERLLKLIAPEDILPTGGIIGIAQLTGCVSHSSNPWFVGPYGLTIAKAQSLPFHPCKGQLGLWRCDYPADLLPSDLQQLAPS